MTLAPLVLSLGAILVLSWAIYVALAGAFAITQTVSQRLTEYRYRPMPWPETNRSEVCPCTAPEGPHREVSP